MGTQEIIQWDSHYLFLVLTLVAALNYVSFFFAFVFQIDFLTDITGSLGFIGAVLIPFVAAKRYDVHRIIIFLTVVITRVELGSFLFIRVIARRRDARFDQMRSSCIRFGTFWTIQIMWAYLVSFNAIFTLGDAMNPPNHIYTIIGGVCALLGFLCQIISDLQKLIFRRNPQNISYPCTSGLWKYSRHPNYLGEVILWWSVFVISVPVLISTKDQWGWCSIISPIFTMLLLLFVSGIPLAEGKALARYYDNPESRKIIEDYMLSTSPLWLFPPQLYRKLPLFLKWVLFFDFPMYHYKTPQEILHQE